MEAYLRTLEKGEKIPEKVVKNICDRVLYSFIFRRNKFSSQNRIWSSSEHQLLSAEILMVNSMTF